MDDKNQITGTNIPDPKEIEKEINEYLSSKYGNRIRVMGTQIGPWPGAAESGGGQEMADESGVSSIRFDMKPAELHEWLDRFVIRQDDAKEVLATKICTHFNRIRYFQERGERDDLEGLDRIKSNVILIGPTGVGKTYLIKLIARKIGVPFVKGDATKFSETGYVGGDVEDLVRDLVHQADGDIEKAQYGIIYIDEIDKIASAGNVIGLDVSRSGVQRNLLKLLEETEVDLKVPHDPVSLMEAAAHFQKTGKRIKRTINTRNILFIVSGAFNGLEEIVSRRMARAGLGFGAVLKEKDTRRKLLPEVKPEDLIEYGFESEFVGRLPVIAVLQDLDEDDLYKILRNRHSSVITAKKQDFKAYEIDIRFTDGALRKIAAKAHEQKTGARSLVSVIEKVLVGFERQLPSSEVTRVCITDETVENPREHLRQVLEDELHPARGDLFDKMDVVERAELMEELKSRTQEFENRFGKGLTGWRLETVVDATVRQGMAPESMYQRFLKVEREMQAFEQEFEHLYGLKIRFSEDAVKELSSLVLNGSEEALIVCRKIFQNYHHGLKLVMERTGQTEFTISKEAVQNPERFLNEMIQLTYRQMEAERVGS
ncbi:MAG: AAA family ATPase [Deltaproteobacteria bacterium]|nr:AAA family ATPase [Deltaproteobacteria bacterium]